ncbi:hypothetical protein EX895_006420 [Sporisorium graminicola]|uniref:Zinc-finger domain-containing protein n=1 Tax=Sporisorium graminicola TaxID=280036 RepID=A0A4U7KNA3_9BASI|nr:hypothetical protein EX895_006420 [Sporisorium graminicola]TKY84518.1 hypothetical protein EX895_006420 [Sporisorium graminicola]
MPLRRHASSRESCSRSRTHTPNKRRANGNYSSVASSSHSSPSRGRSSTNGHTGQATLGDPISPSRPFRSVKATELFIDLLDSSDDEAPPRPTAQSQQQPADYDELDDVVTPELPPADASAPPLPESLSDSFVTPDPPLMGIIANAETPIVSTSQGQLSPDPTSEPSSPPHPPPHPLSSQRPLFSPEDLELQPLYDELKALLDTEQASDADEDEDEDYEQRRLRKLRANDALLAQLGLGTSGHPNPIGDDHAVVSANARNEDADAQLAHSNDTPSRGHGRPKKRGRSDSARLPETAQEPRTNRKKKKYDRRVKFAKDGTTKSAPLPGESFDLAYVELPPLRNRARNEYVFIKDVPDIRPEDLVSWSEDEEEEEDADAGDQDELDEDDAVLGYDAIGRIKKRRKRYQPNVLPDGTVLTSCHQCRRKTPSLKMRCGRGSCILSYCERCITVRYDDMHFDPFAPNFTCPKCLGFCNCSICLRRSGHGDLVHKGREHVLAFSSQLKKLAVEADQDGSVGLKDGTGTLPAQVVALGTETSSRIKRRGNGQVNGRATKSKRLDPTVPAPSPPKRRGRPFKEREGNQIWTPIKLELDLSDEVAEDDVYSPLEEYMLGRLSVARRILKLIAAEQAAPTTAAPSVDAVPRPKLVVRLRIPPRTLSRARTFAVADGVVEKKGKISSYHDAEKDVRSAANHSAFESDAGVLTDRDMLEENTDDAREDDDAQEGEDTVETLFEEGRTQVFAASLLQRHDTTSVAYGTETSPLTGLDDGSSGCSVASSRHNGSRQAEISAEEEEEEEEDDDDDDDDVELSTQASFETAVTSSSLRKPQNMQQLALAVLEDADGVNKAVHADILRVHEPLAFPSCSGSEAGQLGALLDPQPVAGTPLHFLESAFSDLDDAVVRN